MRILISTSTFPANLDDGLPRFVYDLAQAMTEHADVTVMTPRIPGVAEADQLGAVNVERYTYFRPQSWQQLATADGRGMRDNLRSSWLAKLQLPCLLAAQVSTLRKLIKRNAIEAVNAHWMIPQGLTTAFALRRRRMIRFVLHVHAADVYLLNRLPSGRLIARYVVKRADCILADGSHVRDTLDELLGFPSKAQLQPMGVDTNRFRPLQSINESPSQSTGGDFLLFVGRLVEKKGVVYLIRALKLLAQQQPLIRLRIVGDGPLRQSLEQEARELGVEPQIHFFGQQSHEQIVRHMQQARAVVVPSIIDQRGETEGMPTVIVEALAAGAPVIASRVAGIPDVIQHGQTGWLCNPEDEHDLAAKIVEAFSCDRASVQARALEAAQDHDWKQVARNYLRFLKPIDSEAVRPIDPTEMNRSRVAFGELRSSQSEPSDSSVMLETGLLSDARDEARL